MCYTPLHPRTTSTYQPLFMMQHDLLPLLYHFSYLQYQPFLMMQHDSSCFFFCTISTQLWRGMNGAVAWACHCLRTILICDQYQHNISLKSHTTDVQVNQDREMIFNGHWILYSNDYPLSLQRDMMYLQH